MTPSFRGWFRPNPGPAKAVPRPWMLALSVLTSILASAAACGDAAPKPEIKSTSVLGVPVGKTTSIVLYGERLEPKSAAIKPPLAVKLVEWHATDDKNKAKGSRQVTLEVTVPPTCPQDTFELSLMQPDNSVAKTNICVTEATAVEIPIKKPSFSYSSAMLLPGPSVAVTGQLDGDTADVLRFDAKAGETWDVTLLSSRAGSQLDPILRVRDSRHISLVLSTGDKKKDRHITFRVPADGAYYVEITEAEARGGAGFNYRLAVVRKP